MPCNQMEMISASPLKDGFKEAWQKVNHAASTWPVYSGCTECVYADVCDKCTGIQMQFAEPGAKPEGLCERTKQLICSGVRVIPNPECD